MSEIANRKRYNFCRVFAVVDIQDDNVNNRWLDLCKISKIANFADIWL